MRQISSPAIEEKHNVELTVANFGYLGKMLEWYADTRMKGWLFERASAEAKDCGIALWGENKRALEMVAAGILIKTVNRDAGKYKTTCWHIGYINDTEFGMEREYYVGT